MADVRVSVLLPVYNGAGHVGAAIDSILAQSFADFELLVLDDGSTDGTAGVLRGYGDPRMRVLWHENRGLAATLQRGVTEARAPLIARQDHDDISLPERFQAQVARFDADPALVLLGTWTTILGPDGTARPGHRHPVQNGVIQFLGLFDARVVHPSVMMRREAVIAAGGYRDGGIRPWAEDFDLWLRLYPQGRAGNVDTPLLIYRETPGSLSRSFDAQTEARIADLAARTIKTRFQLPADLTVCTDAVRVARRSRLPLSPRPDWAGIGAVLGRVAAAVCAEFPEDAAGIAHALSRLRRRAVIRRLKHAFGR